MTYKHPHIIIVGAGIIGASLAYHLICKNARVTLLDKATQSANNVTEKSFSWIHAGYGESETYLNLRQQAILDWHRIENEFKGQLKINWSGSLCWFNDNAETDRIAQNLMKTDYPVHLVTKQQIRLLEPNLKHVPAQGLFAKDEGAIDSKFTTELFVKAARERGADIQLGNEVLSFITNQSHVTGVVTEHGKITSDIVVLAAGANTATLCQSLRLILPINESPAILISLYNHHPFVNRIVSNPYMEIRAASNTLTLAAENYIDESMENNPLAIAKRTLTKIKEHWRGTENINLINVGVGRRPMTKDGLPIIGQINHVDGLYLLVMHAGVTLAAIVGKLVASEIVSNQDDVLLSSYRLKRFD